MDFLFSDYFIIFMYFGCDILDLCLSYQGINICGEVQKKNKTESCHAISVACGRAWSKSLKGKK